MFNIWHTTLIAAFIVAAYYMGYQHGKRQIKIKKTISKS